MYISDPKFETIWRVEVRDYHSIIGAVPHQMYYRYRILW